METEKYLGIVLWSVLDTSCGCLADLSGVEYKFKEMIQDRGTGRAPYSAYQNGWRPRITTHLNRRTNKEFAMCEPGQIVEFSIRFFNFEKDGQPGHQIPSISAASEYTQEDYEILLNYQQKFEDEKQVTKLKRSAVRSDQYGCHEKETAIEGPRLRTRSL